MVDSAFQQIFKIRSSIVPQTLTAVRPHNLTKPFRQNFIDHSPLLDKGAEFSLDYDKLVIGVGSYSQTFGIPGVKEHGLFLKDVNDARLIRSRVVSCK
jgi:NADH dehydrogenase FAD-containing subunit